MIDPAGKLVTIDSVDFHAFVGFAQSDDAVSRNRVTAFGQLEAYPRSQAADRDRLATAQPFGIIFSQAFGTARNQRLHDITVSDVGRTDGIEELFVIFHFKPFHRFAKGLLANLGRYAGRDFIIQLLSDFRDFSALFQAHGAPDSGARLAGHDKPQPAHLRLGILALQDFDHVAIIELGAKRHMPPVDLCTDGCAAQIGVNCKSKVDRRRALRQLEERALGGERKDTILVDRHARMLEQFLGIMAGVDNFDQVAQPADLPIRLVRLLVCPMRGQPEFVGLVHIACPDLHLHAHRFAVDERGVEASVPVGLGRRDIVLEPSGQELPSRVKDTQSAVTISLVLGNDPERHDVGHLLERDVAFGHLAPD